MDEHNESESLPDRLRSRHVELYRKRIHAPGQAARQYNLSLKEVQFEEGERVFLFHPPGQVE